MTLLRGAAGLELEPNGAVTRLGPGDSLLIPAHVRHRVAWTAQDGPTEEEIALSVEEYCARAAG